MTVVPFPPRRPGPARTLAALIACVNTTQPMCDLTIAKDGTRRRYRLIVEGPFRSRWDVWRNRAWLGGGSVTGVLAAKRRAQRFVVDIGDLVHGGWIEVQDDEEETKDDHPRMVRP